ncbi:putative magnesium transporter NIPA1 [Psilocybe cubensis]|uniref:DUF803-domain-containing protein n=2 Tax=Psilocybe cubensis TaxID=181762 RepID=A0A8H7Y1F7_PSICU|nr:putative magnesium transporter NIPA1 [Psilocybe cubensis]KAH9482842.1 putative magnesium transporter NIPA1 [Psilocybe cubensis]
MIVDPSAYGTVYSTRNLAEPGPSTLPVFRAMDDLPSITTQTLIGIIVAISGNVLISLALNLQKLAHMRVEKKKKLAGDSTNGKNHDTSPDENGGVVAAGTHNIPEEEDVFSDSPTPTERQPLIAFPEPIIRDYGSEASGSPKILASKVKRPFVSRFNPLRIRNKVSQAKYIPVEIMTEDAALHGLPSRNSNGLKRQGSSDSVNKNEGDYLKSKLWWLGFLLMNVGELGNFISYAFAPASVVAPLGTFALMANCFFAPLLLGEYFRKRDLLGVGIAIIGAVTVVLASNASDRRLDPDALLTAILQTPFVIYACIYTAGAIILATFSEGIVGQTWVFVDVGLCALFGGFTVLSTKAISTLLTLRGFEIFREWITYPLIAVLMFTGIGQIRYLNRALMRFDSKVVIPIQFVLFTLSAITGSAILYGDFQKAKFHEVVTFLYGCAATFAGVFIIAWTPKNSGQNDGQVIGSSANSINDGEAPNVSDGDQLGLGTVGRRSRATLVLPSGVTGPKDTPSLGRKRSAVMGISPAQHLLLVHTPPRSIPSRTNADFDVERDGTSPDYTGRRRTMSWYGYEGTQESRDRGTRESSLVGRLNNDIRVGSLEERSRKLPGHL